jgi:1-acyl-sn-glycerol-3-phosphate acyltransferase
MTAPVPGFPERFPVRSDDRRPWRYRLVAGTARLIFRLRYGLHPVDFRDVANIPAGPGPLIVASNHLSNLDPVIMGAFFPRTLFAMAKRELFPNRLVAWMWAGCNTFPVDRGSADRRALRTAIDVLRRGGRLLLFIEGTRATSPGMKRAEPGVGFLLRRTAADGPGIPILPVAVWGTERALVKGKFFPQRASMHVRFGPVFSLPAGEARDDQALADRVAAHVAALLPPEYRGVYTGGAEAVSAAP